MTNLMIDTRQAMRDVLAAPESDRADVVRRMWAPMRDLMRFAPGEPDLLDLHRQSFGFPLEGRDAELAEALDRLEAADAWTRIRTALDAAAPLLDPAGSGPDVRTLLVLGDPGDAHFRDELQGLSAFGGISGFIVLTLWPTDTVLERLEAIAVHELHHNVRYGPGGVVWNPMTVTLGEQVVAEGLADAFARERYGETGLTHFAEDARGDTRVLRTVAAALGETDMRRFTAWIHGDASARRFGIEPVGLPTGAGYAAGLELVDAYLAATGTDAAASVRTPAAEVLAVALPALGLAGTGG